MRLVLLSDTHGRLDALDVPEGDVLLHAGDLTPSGGFDEVRRAVDAIERLPHGDKVVIAGNHDFLFEREPERARELVAGLTYLEDEGARVQGLTLWGSPWQPWFHDWAFNLERGAPLAAKWSAIPAGLDVLLTHGPPQGILDRTVHGLDVGCEELRAAVERTRPRLHVFGHIHEAYGHRAQGATLFVNASNLDFRYRPVHAPMVVEWGAQGPRVVEPC